MPSSDLHKHRENPHTCEINKSNINLFLKEQQQQSWGDGFVDKLLATNPALSSLNLHKCLCAFL